MFRPLAVAFGLAVVAPSALFAQAATQAETPGEAPAATPADAAAAPQPAQMDTGAAYEAARNQLGILRHCETEGFTGPEAVAAQERMIAMMPAGDAGQGDAAEAKGAEGTVAAMGAEISLTEGASNQGSTVESQCQQIEELVNQAADSLPDAG